MSRRRIARGGFGVDRLSQLPYDIKESIVKYLPLRDAVRTSILSTEWRHQWVTTPHLDFGEDFQKSLRAEIDVETIILHVLALHRGTIVKFVFHQQKDTSIDQWFNLLENHPIEELTLQFHFDAPHNLLPELLYRFDRLRHLYLGNADVEVPLAFKEFTNLVKLELDCVDFAPEHFEIFISKCPMLEALIVFECTTPFDVRIDAPNLKFFEFEGKFSSFFFVNTSIEEISIEGIDGEDGSVMPTPELVGTESNLIRVFGQLPSIRRLKSDEYFLQFLIVGDVPQELPNSLNYLTNIEFSCVDFENLDVVACIVCLIRSSPHLQSLEITCLPSIDDLVPAATVQYMRAQQKVERPLSRSLKNVKIDWFSGFKIEMEFLRLILWGTVALRQLKIGNSSIDVAPQYELHKLKSLARFHRASPEAVIIIDILGGLRFDAPFRRSLRLHAKLTDLSGLETETEILRLLLRLPLLFSFREIANQVNKRC